MVLKKLHCRDSGKVPSDIDGSAAARDTNDVTMIVAEDDRGRPLRPKRFHAAGWMGWQAGDGVIRTGRGGCREVAARMPELARPRAPDVREIPAEPEKPTAIPHLEGRKKKLPLKRAEETGYIQDAGFWKHFHCYRV
jgi:hypothetical protein